LKLWYANPFPPFVYHKLLRYYELVGLPATHLLISLVPSLVYAYCFQTWQDLSCSNNILIIKLAKPSDPGRVIQISPWRLV